MPEKPFMESFADSCSQQAALISHVSKYNGPAEWVNCLLRGNSAVKALDFLQQAPPLHVGKR